MKSWKALDINCGPLSDHNMSGIAVRQNDCLKVLIRCVIVVL